MTNEGVDDIFKDFEHKIKDKIEAEHADKKETHKAHEKKLSEEERLKIKYQKAEHALKEEHRKEKEALEEKRKKEVAGHETVHSAKSSINIEKAAYVAVILVLAAYIAIDLSFYHKAGVDIESDQTITAAAVKVENETDDVGEEVIEEEQETIEELVVEEEKELSGVITLNIDNIYTEIPNEDNDMGYINKIVFTIDNGKDKVLTPVVQVYAYDGEMDEKWETWIRGDYTYKAGIPSGSQHTGIIDLSPKTFINLDIKKNIRLTLNDTEDGFITSVNEKAIIS